METPDLTQLALLLTFDAETQTRLDQLILALEALGLQPYPDGHHVPAHITLAAFTPSSSGSAPAEGWSQQADLLNTVQNLAAETAPVEIRFDSLGVFSRGKGVIFLSPVITRRLLELHSRVQAMLAVDGLAPNAYYLPDMWVPHVTLAVEQPPEALPVIFKTCQQAGVFTSGLADAMLLVEFPPPRQLASFRLGSSRA
jgi:2'-5' RNA ligase